MTINNVMEEEILDEAITLMMEGANPEELMQEVMIIVQQVLF